MTDFYERKLKGNIDDVRARLEAALKARKFGTLHVHDVTGTLNSKGVPFETQMLIMDICNPHLAKRALEATDNRIAPLLPCSVALWQDGEEVVVRYLRPTVLVRFFQDSTDLTGLARDVNAGVEAAIEDTAGS